MKGLSLRLPQVEARPEGRPPASPAIPLGPADLGGGQGGPSATCAQARPPSVATARRGGPRAGARPPLGHHRPVGAPSCPSGRARRCPPQGGRAASARDGLWARPQAKGRGPAAAMGEGRPLALPPVDDGALMEPPSPLPQRAGAGVPARDGLGSHGALARSLGLRRRASSLHLLRRAERELPRPEGGRGRIGPPCSPRWGAS